MTNYRMIKPCFIGDAEFPVDSVHDGDLLPGNRGQLWKECGLAVETDEEVTADVANAAIKVIADAEAKADKSIQRKAEAKANAQAKKKAAEEKFAKEKKTRQAALKKKTAEIDKGGTDEKKPAAKPKEGKK